MVPGENVRAAQERPRSVTESASSEDVEDLRHAGRRAASARRRGHLGPGTRRFGKRSVV